MDYATDYPKLKRPNLLLRWKVTQEAYLLQYIKRFVNWYLLKGDSRPGKVED